MSGEQLKSLREAKGLTQAELAELIGIGKRAHSRVYEYEKGKRNITAAMQKLFTLVLEPLPNVPSKDEAFIFEFLSKQTAVGECHIWTGTKDEQGYGVCYFKGASWRSHRVAYTLFNGDIPDGLLVMHSCDNPSCVNPKHLSLGTPKDNAEDCVSKHRNAQQQKTHCPHGHEYTAENTIVMTRNGKFRRRYCATCYRAKVNKQIQHEKEKRAKAKALKHSEI